VLAARRQLQELRRHAPAGGRSLQRAHAQQRFLAQFGQQWGGGLAGRDFRYIAGGAQWTCEACQQVAVDQLRQLEIGVVPDQAFGLAQGFARIGLANQLVDVNQPGFGFAVTRLALLRGDRLGGGLCVGAGLRACAGERQHKARQP
jgi:hypothetical protein